MMIDIEKLRELEKNATPKPWSYAKSIPEMAWLDETPDGKLITEMRNQLPELLDEIDRLRAALTEVIYDINTEFYEYERINRFDSVIEARKLLSSKTEPTTDAN